MCSITFLNISKEFPIWVYVNLKLAIISNFEQAFHIANF